MKRAVTILLIYALSMLLLFTAVTAAANAAWKRAGRQPWPAGLGTLEDLPSRFPKREPNAEALRLAELARPLGIEFIAKSAAANPTYEAIRTFVDAECARDVAAIPAPPPPVAAFLARQGTAIDALRDHLIASREIAWAVDLDKGLNAPIPNLLAHLNVARLLIARALVRARNSDPGAWDDLHAASMVDRHLQRRPDLISQLVTLAIARRVNAAAWKLPGPAPAWLAEDQAVDRLRLLLQGAQFDSWGMWRYGPDESPGWFPRAYFRASVTNLAIHQREIAFEVSRMSACALDGKAYFERHLRDLPRWNIFGRIVFANVSWSRALRYQAEREATANALRVRAGQPLMASSRCSEGAWRYEDGRLSFTGRIPPTNAADMPLSLRIP